MECGYQTQECPGCHESKLKKDLAEHENVCDKIEVTCSQCNIIFKRADEALHTECRCVAQQLRNELNDHKLEVNKQIKQMTETIEQLQQEFETSQRRADEETRQLRQEFEVFKRQTGEQTKQIIEMNYQLQENFETSKQQTSERIDQLAENLQVFKKGPDAKIQKLIRTLERKLNTS